MRLGDSPTLRARLRRLIPFLARSARMRSPIWSTAAGTDASSRQHATARGSRTGRVTSAAGRLPARTFRNGAETAAKRHCPAIDTNNEKSVSFRHRTGGDDMTRKMSTRGAGDSHPDGAGSSEAGEQGNGRLSVGRRALLTRGSVVAAGVVGAGAVATAVAGPASAQVGDPVLMATANDAGDGVPPTELTAENAGIATFIIVNEGVDTTNSGAGPNLNLVPSSSTVPEPASTTVGGDLTATGDGTLWFTHNFTPGPGITPAPVHTEATANVFAPLGTPTRIVDTRS